MRNFLGENVKCIIVTNVMPFDYLNEKYLTQL
jgi:hypothetical protein